MMRWRMTTSWRRRAAARLAARAARARRARADRPPALRIALRALRLTARALLVIAVMTTTIATVEVLDLWWTRPPTRTTTAVNLHDPDIYNFCANYCYTEWQWRTDTDLFLADGGNLREEHHSWVATFRWSRKATDTAYNDVELKLGESEHIGGLGTLTLVEVWPEPLSERLYRDFAGIGIPPGWLGRCGPLSGFLIRLEPDPGITIYDCSSPRDGEDEDEECRPVHEP